MSYLNGNGFPHPVRVPMMGQAQTEAIPTRPLDMPPTRLIPERAIPLEVYPLAAGVAMLLGGFSVRNRDTKTVLFGLGSTLTAMSTVALFAKL